MEDKLKEAWALVKGNPSDSSESAVTVSDANNDMAAVELENRQRMLSSAGGSPSTSGREEGIGLPAAILKAYESTGHTMSCLVELRYILP